MSPMDRGVLGFSLRWLMMLKIFDDHGATNREKIDRSRHETVIMIHELTR